MSEDLRRTPQQERSRRSLDAILDATAELLAETDPETITMSAIGDRAGVSKAAIYRYYPDRPAVIRALAQRYLEPMSEKLTASVSEGDAAADVSDAVVDAYYQLFRDEPVVRAIWITGFSYPEIGEFCVDFDRQVADVVVTAACGAEASEASKRRGLVVLRALRSTVELAMASGDDGDALVDELKTVLRGGVAA